LKSKRISKSSATLVLLAIFSVTACNPDDATQKETSTITASVDKKDNPHQGRPPGPPGGGETRTVCEALKEGPMRSSEHGPMDNADLNRDGTVLREELEAFMDQGKYRRITILTFFDLFDSDKDGKLSDEELAKVDPPFGFDGTDADGDCVVTRKEVIAYASQTGRSYRKSGQGQFFDLVDNNADNKATPTEIEAAHKSGLLARF
jgi:Ca2+-binding EF-hand superfamily protein